MNASKAGLGSLQTIGQLLFLVLFLPKAWLIKRVTGGSIDNLTVPDMIVCYILHWSDSMVNRFSSFSKKCLTHT